MRQPNFHEIENLQLNEFPNGSVELDNDGQIVIYTGEYNSETGQPKPDPNSHCKFGFTGCTCQKPQE